MSSCSLKFRLSWGRSLLAGVPVWYPQDVWPRWDHNPCFPFTFLIPFSTLEKSFPLFLIPSTPKQLYKFLCFLISNITRKKKFSGWLDRDELCLVGSWWMQWWPQTDRFCHHKFQRMGQQMRQTCRCPNGAVCDNCLKMASLFWPWILLDPWLGEGRERARGNSYIQTEKSYLASRFWCESHVAT